MIAEYTHSGNIEIKVTAIDYVTNTFTKIGHELVNGDVLFLIPILLSGERYQATGSTTFNNYLPYTSSSKLYVINKTDDTFQLSSTSGGTAITLTENSKVTINSFKFEKESNAILNIDLVDEYKAVRIVFNGFLTGQSWLEVINNKITYLMNGIGSSSITINRGVPYFFYVDYLTAYCIGFIEMHSGISHLMKTDVLTSTITSTGDNTSKVAFQTDGGLITSVQFRATGSFFPNVQWF